MVNVNFQHLECCVSQLRSCTYNCPNEHEVSNKQLKILFQIANLNMFNNKILICFYQMTSDLIESSQKAKKLYYNISLNILKIEEIFKIILELNYVCIKDIQV